MGVAHGHTAHTDILDSRVSVLRLWVSVYFVVYGDMNYKLNIFGAARRANSGRLRAGVPRRKRSDAYVTLPAPHRSVLRTHSFLLKYEISAVFRAKS